MYILYILLHMEAHLCYILNNVTRRVPWVTFCTRRLTFCTRRLPCVTFRTRRLTFCTILQ